MTDDDATTIEQRLASAEEHLAAAEALITSAPVAGIGPITVRLLGASVEASLAAAAMLAEIRQNIVAMSGDLAELARLAPPAEQEPTPPALFDPPPPELWIVDEPDLDATDRAWDTRAEQHMLADDERETDR